MTSNKAKASSTSDGSSNNRTNGMDYCALVHVYSVFVRWWMDTWICSLLGSLLRDYICLVQEYVFIFIELFKEGNLSEMLMDKRRRRSTKKLVKLTNFCS